MSEGERPAEVGVGLVSRSDEEEEEEPAAVAAGQVDGEDEEEDVDAEEDRSEIDLRLDGVETDVEDDPRDQAVGEADRADQPRAHRVARYRIGYEPVAQQHQDGDHRKA